MKSVPVDVAVIEPAVNVYPVPPVVNVISFIPIASIPLVCVSNPLMLIFLAVEELLEAIVTVPVELIVRYGIVGLAAKVTVAALPVRLMTPVPAPVYVYVPAV